MADLREGEVWGEVTEASLNRLLERKGVVRNTRGTMTSLTQTKEKGEKEPPKPKDAFFAMSKETVGRFARGFADMNPLYHKEAYAKKSPWGRIIAPPAAICYAETVNGATDGFPGCHTIWRGVEYDWVRPMFADEVVKSKTSLEDAYILEDSKFAGGKAAVQNYATEILTLQDEHIGTYRTSWQRFSRSGAKKESKYAGIERHMWTDEELEGVWQEYHDQNLKNRRGSDPLYFEDVGVGDVVPYIIKGPVTLTSKIAFEMAFGAFGWFVGHELALALWEKAPRLPIRNEENVPEPPVAIHWTNERCETYLGMPGAYEAGYERLNWLTQLINNWIGDHGKIRKLSCQFRGFHWQGDACRLHAEVIGKRIEGDEHLVDLRIWTESHPRGERTTDGEMTVELPSKASA
ncbi:MAG: MaoC family dehydratase N-terminal domain-containing protein [Deltaproteobacteria bacterium]|nr:MaoC family dehydratase N-terminal domain-containing protein [Deltaproteobacteria bacterium]MBW2445812.1 MaoC family dehydratase N-terminal domain-containing protein [Deltaproteobacteria bacterium]